MLLTGITLVSLLTAALVCLGCGCFGSAAWLWVLPLGFLGSWILYLILAFVFLVAVIERVRMDRPQEEDSPFYRGVAMLYIQAIISLVRLKIHTKGMEQAPKDGRFLLVSNHFNDIDPAVLMHVFPKSQLAFISKRENDGKFLIGKIQHKLLCQPINRENDRDALKTILRCIQILKEDKASIGVFPEGYTSLDGKLHPFRNGVFKIAMKARVPIVVCTVQDTQYVLPKLAKGKLGRHIHIHLLGVIYPEEYQGLTATDVGNRIHAMMAQDLEGQAHE